MGFLRRLFCSASKENLTELLSNGAILIDVRSESEFAEAHALGSDNIALQNIGKASTFLDRDKTYILVCASGIRSQIATAMLRRKGFERVYNGGRWTNFQED